MPPVKTKIAPKKDSSTTLPTLQQSETKKNAVVSTDKTKQNISKLPTIIATPIMKPANNQSKLKLNSVADERKEKAKVNNTAISSAVDNPGTTSEIVQNSLDVEPTSSDKIEPLNSLPTDTVENKQPADVDGAESGDISHMESVEDNPTETSVEIVDNNGNVILLYELYNELFPIKNGELTSEEIDDVYNLTFVMPKCLIHLSQFNPQQRKEAIESNNGLLDFDSFYLKENPVGHFHGLISNASYYVYVEQEAEQLLRDQEVMRSKVATMTMMGVGQGNHNGIVRDDGRVLESCSCIYGNPCVDEYGCKDWDNRLAIATKNGWKGF